MGADDNCSCRFPSLSFGYFFIKDVFVRRRLCRFDSASPPWSSSRLLSRLDLVLVWRFHHDNSAGSCVLFIAPPSTIVSRLEILYKIPPAQSQMYSTLPRLRHLGYCQTPSLHFIYLSLFQHRPWIKLENTNGNVYKMMSNFWVVSSWENLFKRLSWRRPKAKKKKKGCTI
jgi:hypothetical protein